MTYRERIAAVRAMGYTTREAGFLEFVALHSGYFLRRQYNQFLDRKRGGTAAALIRKLLQKEHVSVEPSRTEQGAPRNRLRAECSLRLGWAEMRSR